MSVLFLSCGLNRQQKKEKQKKENEEIKYKVISGLVSKYNIKYKLDTLYYPEYQYTIDFKPVINSKFQLIDYFEIKDIYEKDSCEYISLSAGFFPSIYFDFLITIEQGEKLRNEDNKLLLVVSISNIKKINFSLEGQIENSVSATVDLKNSDNFLGKGRIIEIISLKKSIAE